MYDLMVAVAKCVADELDKAIASFALDDTDYHKGTVSYRAAHQAATAWWASSVREGVFFEAHPWTGQILVGFVHGIEEFDGIADKANCPATHGQSILDDLCSEAEDEGGPCCSTAEDAFNNHLDEDHDDDCPVWKSIEAAHVEEGRRWNEFERTTVVPTRHTNTGARCGECHGLIDLVAQPGNYRWVHVHPGYKDHVAWCGVTEDEPF